MSVTDITKLYNYHRQRQGIGMEDVYKRQVLDHIFQQTVKRLPILCEMLRYLDTDFPHDKILNNDCQSAHAYDILVPASIV